MKRTPAAVALVLAGAVALPAGAAAPPAGTHGLLLEASSPSDLRARLLAHARAAEAADPADAGAARYYAGLSYERAGERDSAIACYRRALELRGTDEDRIALADALLARREEGDVAAAGGLLAAVQQQISEGSEALQMIYAGRRAWAAVLAGHPDSALALFAPFEARLSTRPAWRYRLALAYKEAGLGTVAYRLLLTLAAESRGQDDEVMGLLGEILEPMGAARRLGGEIDRVIRTRDENEARALGRVGGRRIRFAADDGFPLGGFVMLPEGAARRRAAIVFMAPGDTVADYDSLGVALNRAGLAVMLLDVRGSGWSVAPMCPLPDTWEGREERLQELASGDVRAALRALARVAALDSSRYLVAGVGEAAPLAARAAELDPRVGALLLVSPRPARVDLGPMRARLARTQVPVFFQVGPEDFENLSVTDALYQAGNRRASRVAEARVMGSGALQFYHDPSIAARLIRWVAETLSGPATRDARPSTRRGG